MEPRIWVTKVENRICGSKSLKIGLQIVWNMRKNISKICRQIFNLPEVTGDTVGPEMKNFGTGSQKIYFSKVHEKLFRDFYSHFLISRHQTAVQVFEVLSVVMTSSPEVVRTKKILSILGFSNLLNSILNFVFGHGLRAFASLGSIDALHPRSFRVIQGHSGSFKVTFILFWF